ncbi:MAG: Uma2 family endonuclease [Lewinellaceae bacterium]|nr:Uma2 family endonuclease [Phaeodactylibacter sp.]MCB9346143.1 Uma2 family endonuclease [Lewinellaceae bacterium]
MDGSKTIEKTEVSTQKHRFTVEEYHRMGEAGVLDEARVELIDGEIYNMSPINSPHSGTVKWLNRLLNRLLGDEFIISIQDPITLNSLSEPEPDVAILKMREDFYTDSHPQPEDVLLLIEVADTSLEKDKRVKLPNYAQAGISEVWIMDINEQCIEVYTHPWEDTYRNKSTYLINEVMETTLLGGRAVKDIFPQRNT